MRAIPGGGLFGRGAFAPIVGIVIAESRVVFATRDQVIVHFDDHAIGAILFAAHRELWVAHFRECIGQMQE